MGGSCSNNLTSGLREVEDVPCQHQAVANYRVARAMSCMGDDEDARMAGASPWRQAGRDCAVPLGPAAGSRSASGPQENEADAYLGKGASAAEKRRIGCDLARGDRSLAAPRPEGKRIGRAAR